MSFVFAWRCVNHHAAFVCPQRAEFTSLVCVHWLAVVKSCCGRLHAVPWVVLWRKLVLERRLLWHGRLHGARSVPEIRHAHSWTESHSQTHHHPRLHHVHSRTTHLHRVHSPRSHCERVVVGRYGRSCTHSSIACVHVASLPRRAFCGSGGSNCGGCCLLLLTTQCSGSGCAR